MYTSELCNALVLWGWSRNLGNIHKHNQIVFTKEAEQLILRYASEFGKKYSSKIPLVEGANHRIKLARMAVAAAIRVFSTDETCEKVIVTEDHVHFVAQVQSEAYDKPSMGYKLFSERVKEEHQMGEDAPMVKAYLVANKELVDAFKLMKVFSFRQLQELSGYDPDILREHVHFLADHNIVSIKGNGQWQLTPNGLSLIKEMRRNQNE